MPDTTLEVRYEMLEVRYEDVVADLESQMLRIIDDCGLEWDDARLSYHQTARLRAAPEINGKPRSSCALQR
jgi:hypothetical protein